MLGSWGQLVLLLLCSCGLLVLVLLLLLELLLGMLRSVGITCPAVKTWGSDWSWLGKCRRWGRIPSPADILAFSLKSSSFAEIEETSESELVFGEFR